MCKEGLEEEAVRAFKRMNPEEGLVVHPNHSRLIYQIYLAGVKYRSAHESLEKGSRV